MNWQMIVALVVLLAVNGTLLWEVHQLRQSRNWWIDRFMGKED